jgi:hypothetical protein
MGNLIQAFGHLFWVLGRIRAHAAPQPVVMLLYG